ncbi:major facilitator superfamily transporter multidrug resistance [Grosmannia clavigera kw1407]|uniref:Major facilitator superfamily transporter multidrug resistance n=1 Tax=Grosmannia clavigera (strain kw1407 / UAMH 11150) TaxID=655863 RepID=F0XH71_GROCL|nr:major facilitator superfamily transporter multidrug resistance [Grosmannia clavigera kw1407]EFX03062.1 major facilitator superfamily transporter multidrug resistance [Grosmannia clavigera kw1407]
MDEKGAYQSNGPASRPRTSSSSATELGGTQAKTQEKEEQPKTEPEPRLSGSSAKHEGQTESDNEDDDDIEAHDRDYSRRLARVKSQDHGTPDIDHDAGEAIALGHDLDMELAMAPDIESIRRIETRGSAKSKLSRLFTSTSKTSKKHGIRAELLPLMDLDRGIVGWESQDDPEMPLNFPPAKKWLLAGLLSAITFITPFASSILSPGISHVDLEFHNSNVLIASLMVSIYLLGYCLGPLLLAPLSEIYGRKIVLTSANVFFCCWQIGCARAPNIASLIVFRLLAGVGGAGCITLGGGLISDIFRVEDRGVAMGIWALGPLFGPTIGPLVGGFMAETIGWRWDFWVVLIAGAILTITIEILNKETSHPILIQRKVRRLKTELGRDDLRSCYETGEKSTAGQVLKSGLVRPIKMLFLSPMVFSLSLYIAFVYGVLYLLFTTIPTVFQETYGFNVGLTGLVYLSLGVGNLVGWLGITMYSDKTVIRLAKANNGVFVPEMRLATTIFFGFFLPITFFWYGWCAEKKVHWIATILSLIPFGFGIIGLFLPITTYLVDAYPMYAASAIAANTVLRSLVGALLPLAGPRMYSSLGLGWGNSLLGFLSIAMIPVPMLIYKYGKRLREMQTFKL